LKCPNSDCNGELSAEMDSHYVCKKCGTVVYKSMAGSLDERLPANLPVDEVVKHAKYG